MNLSTNINYSKNVKGVTLIELLIALAISSVLVGALYWTFIRQQKTYTVQEQVVDTQQNLRVAINKMVREIRMAGFGNVSGVIPFDANGGPYTNTISVSNNPNNVSSNDQQITIIGAFEQVSTLKEEPEATDISNTKVRLNGTGSQFSTSGNKRYICIGGLETTTVTNIETNIDGDKITLGSRLKYGYKANVPVYKVKAITYFLRWDNENPTMPVLARQDNTDGAGNSYPLAENVENLQFSLDPPTQTINVTVTARTKDRDWELGTGGTGGDFRRRTVTSLVQLRNMGL